MQLQLLQQHPLRQAQQTGTGQAIRLQVKLLLLHSDLLSYFVPAKRLVVCLEESVYIHNIKDMKLLKTLLNTPTNPTGMRMTSV